MPIAARLEKTQECLVKRHFPRIKELLTAGRDVFVVTHAGKRPTADRAYIATWALASYLMFDRHVLGYVGIGRICQTVNRGGDRWPRSRS